MEWWRPETGDLRPEGGDLRPEGGDLSRAAACGEPPPGVAFGTGVRTASRKREPYGDAGAGGETRFYRRKPKSQSGTL